MELYENLLFARRYRLETRLGAGGFGEVWRALDNMTGHPVAIKIHLEGDSARAAQEIVKEYTRVMTIHHDNLLTPLHVDVAEGTIPYLIMELCEYDLSERDLTEKEVWQLIRDVASGLKRLADNKKTRVRSDGSTSEVSDPIIHQDIKPANILMRSNGMYAISDFGISKRRLSTLSTSDQTVQTQQMDNAMTVDYAAPERFPQGGWKAGPASDIWSLGAMLFEIVEGKLPFDNGGGNCLNLGIPVPPISRKGYSYELKGVIYDCMAKSPADRPTAAQLKDYAGKVLKEEPRVKTWRHQEPISPEPPTPISSPNPIHKSPEPPTPASSPNHIRKWVYIVIALAAIALGALLAQFTSEPKKTYSQQELLEITEKGKKFKIEGNYEEAIHYYRIAADQGYAEAQCQLGYMYSMGYGVSQDHSEAVRWYRKSAEQGYAIAQCNLGLCYLSGEGVPQDYTEAVRWYRKSAEQGDADAQCTLGYMYENGYSVSQDYSEAVRWFRKSAEQGNALAQCKLGLRYLSGEGVTQDYSEAVYWYRKSADQGDANAQYFLGYLYANGYGVSQDYSEAVRWYCKSAEQGYAIAQYLLGICYRYGRGVAQDDSEAVRWYRKSAEQGYAEAQCNLGYMYFMGYGVPKNDSEAVSWFRKSAEQGNADAQCNLGLCYEYGWGVDVDVSEAKRWYQKAADQGNETAKKQLQNL